MAAARHVLVTGATGYLGSRLVPLLRARGHTVAAVVRPGSASGGSTDAGIVVADPLVEGSYRHAMRDVDTLVHLIGVRHPSPAKAAQFRDIDLTSLQVALHAARACGTRHFIYLSVAQPAPVMRAYVSVRAECESLLRKSGLAVTALRPWYVLGPGHRWPYLLRPMYWALERIHATRSTARRLGLVTLQQMLTAMIWAVEHPAREYRVMDVPLIRAGRSEDPAPINH